MLIDQLKLQWERPWPRRQEPALAKILNQCDIDQIPRASVSSLDFKVRSVSNILWFNEPEEKNISSDNMSQSTILYLAYTPTICMNALRGFKMNETMFPLLKELTVRSN